MLSRRTIHMVLVGLDVPPHSVPLPCGPGRVSRTTTPSASALTSCRSTASRDVGVPTSWSPQSSLPRRTLESVPSQASHDPPPGAAAIAVGRGSVSPCGAKLTAGDPRPTSVIFVAGEAPDVRPQSPDVGPDGVVVGEGVGVPAGVPVGDDGTVGRIHPFTHFRRCSKGLACRAVSRDSTHGCRPYGSAVEAVVDGAPAATTAGLDQLSQPRRRP
ncbi:hypothetical protein FRAHR75_90015 [Frankia sp. Hr75.2]|nr:hypothetical protein FRAHR75_90015 [Frankia sp. Hr75.2]